MTVKPEARGAVIGAVTGIVVVAFGTVVVALSHKIETPDQAATRFAVIVLAIAAAAVGTIAVLQRLASRTASRQTEKLMETVIQSHAAQGAATRELIEQKTVEFTAALDRLSERVDEATTTRVS